MHDGQADSRALKFLGAVQSLKNTEQLARVTHVKARSVVADEIDVLIFLLFAHAADFDDCRLTLAGIFKGIREQVQPDLLQQRWIALARRQVADANLDLPPFPLGGQLLDGIAHQPAGIHGPLV